MELEITSNAYSYNFRAHSELKDKQKERPSLHPEVKRMIVIIINVSFSLVLVERMQSSSLTGLTPGSRNVKASKMNLQFLLTNLEIFGRIQEVPPILPEYSSLDCLIDT